MANPAALLPVPFYAPVRTLTGNAGTVFNFSSGPEGALRDAHLDEGLASQVDARGVYNQSGLFVGNPWIGRLLNIWA